MISQLVLYTRFSPGALRTPNDWACSHFKAASDFTTGASGSGTEDAHRTSEQALMSRRLYLPPHFEMEESVAGTGESQQGSAVSIVTAREARKAALFRPTIRPQARLANEPSGYLGDGVIDRE